MSAIDVIGGGVTSQLVSLALDAALARHAAIATNIANVATPGFQPLTARFDQLVEQLQATAGDRSLDATTGGLAQSMSESLESQPLMVDTRSSEVQLDMQMAELSKNSLHYQALLTAQGKLMDLAQLAIGEGKM